MVEKLYECVLRIFNDWNMEKEEIAHLFRIRNKKAALEPMNKQIECFVAALFALNNITIENKEKLLEEIDKLVLKPINCKERLTFLLEQPAHYHSFIQLSELYDELRKQLEKTVAMNKTRI